MFLFPRPTIRRQWGHDPSIGNPSLYWSSTLASSQFVRFSVPLPSESSSWPCEPSRVLERKGAKSTMISRSSGHTEPSAASSCCVSDASRVISDAVPSGAGNGRKTGRRAKKKRRHQQNQVNNNIHNNNNSKRNVEWFLK